MKRSNTYRFVGALVAIVAILVAVVVMTGCLSKTTGPESGPTATAPSGPAAPGATAAAPAAPAGKKTQLTVYVPCAFAPASAKIKALFEQAHPDVTVVPVVENVEVLFPKIAKGDKPDVFMCIGDKEIEALAAKKLVSYQKPMCFTTLVLVVPLSNPAKVATLADLAKADVKTLAVGTPETSVGFYAQKTLVDNKVWDKVKDKLVRPQYPVQLLKLASAGKVQASIAYGACFRAKEEEEKQMVAKIKLITDFQDKYCLTMACPAAVITGAPNQELGKAFVDFLATDACQQIFSDGGFMKLSDPKCFATRADQKTGAKAGAKAGAKPAKAGAKPAVPAGT
jgi:molybdate transport system substrate-binding protein